jgi:hypothetical protein
MENILEIMNEFTKHEAWKREQVQLIERMGETLVAIRILFKSRLKPLEREYINAGIEDARKLLDKLNADK